jgi:hypothetical protein
LADWGIYRAADVEKFKKRTRALDGMLIRRAKTQSPNSIFERRAMMFTTLQSHTRGVLG